MTLYSVREWNDKFENNRSRELKRLGWVMISNDQDSDAYTELVTMEEGPAMLGCWYAILQIASKCKPRGTLIRENGEPHTPSSVGRMSHLPAGLVLRALGVLVELRWLASAPYEISAESRRQVRESAIPSLPSSPVLSVLGGVTEGGAERPSWKEFWDYCQRAGGPVEWYAQDKFYAAEQKNWTAIPNWRAYAERVRGWWHNDGRPLHPKAGNGNGSPSSALPAWRQINNLEEEISKHPANRESTFHRQDATELQRADLRAKRIKLKELKSA